MDHTRPFTEREVGTDIPAGLRQTKIDRSDLYVEVQDGVPYSWVVGTGLKQVSLELTEKKGVV